MNRKANFLQKTTIATLPIVFVGSTIFFGLKNVISVIAVLMVAVIFFGVVIITFCLMIEDIIWGVDGPPLSKSLNKLALKHKANKENKHYAKMAAHQAPNRT